MAFARYIDDYTYQGCPAVRLENDHVAVTMLPEHGGKIVEILDRRTGRNWLWSNADLPHRALPGPGSYESRLDSGGWDEIMLSVSPCTVRLPDGPSLHAPDHGDLVGRPWQRGAAGVDDSGNAYCLLTARGQAATYEWSRKLVLERNRARLRLEYHVENSGSVGLPFFWCAHPLLATEQGMRVLLPEGLVCRLAQTNGASASRNDATLRWPHLPDAEGRLVDVSRRIDPVAPEAGFAAKVFVRSAEPAFVAVECAAGRDRLVLQYDRDEIPWLGLWINDRGWTGTGGRPYLNLGLEPSTASSDSLEQAVARDEIAILLPGEVRRWWLEVSLGHADRPPGAAAGTLQ